MQLEIAIFVTSLVMLLLVVSLVLLGENLNLMGTFTLILSIFGLAYSTAGFF